MLAAVTARRAVPSPILVIEPHDARLTAPAHLNMAGAGSGAIMPAMPQRCRWHRGRTLCPSRAGACAHAITFKSEAFRACKLSWLQLFEQPRRLGIT